MSLNEAENNLDSINKVLKLIVYNKNETVNSVERLNNFFGDLDWMNSLLEEPNVQETQILRTFLMQNKLSTRKNVGNQFLIEKFFVLDYRMIVSITVS